MKDSLRNDAVTDQNGTLKDRGTVSQPNSIFSVCPIRAGGTK